MNARIALVVSIKKDVQKPKEISDCMHQKTL